MTKQKNPKLKWLIADLAWHIEPIDMIRTHSRPLPLMEAVVRCFRFCLLGALLLASAGQWGNQKASGQTSGTRPDPNQQFSGDDSGPALIQAIESSLINAIADCEQSVVAITRVRNDSAPPSPMNSLPFVPTLQLSNEPTSEDFVPAFFGSGIIVSEDGFIVTCAHILDDPRKHSYYVWLDRRCYSASVIAMSAQVQASDPFTDLAVLKIEATSLKTIPRATDPPRKGQLVIALGNPNAIARDGQASASWGMISNVNRFAPREKDQSPTDSIHHMGTLIQTDVHSPIGTSGGALVNWRGQLVGMTTNLLANAGQEQPAGFAIAVDEFFERVVEVLKQGKQPEFGFLGVQPENLRAVDLDRGLSGARVSMVIPGLPGSRAGLREGDIIFQVGNSSVGNRNDLFRELSRVPIGTGTKLRVRRLRAGNWQELSMEAELTKKFIATDRPAFGLHGPPTWRGAQVEYGSAIAGELDRISVVRDSPYVAFLNVAPDSPTWRAGLRAGFGVISINGQTIQSPERFHELASRTPGRVTLSAISNDGKQLTVTVEPTPE